MEVESDCWRRGLEDSSALTWCSATKKCWRTILRLAIAMNLEAESERQLAVSLLLFYTSVSCCKPWKYWCWVLNGYKVVLLRECGFTKLVLFFVFLFVLFAVVWGQVLAVVSQVTYIDFLLYCYQNRVLPLRNYKQWLLPASTTGCPAVVTETSYLL